MQFTDTIDRIKKCFQSRLKDPTLLACDVFRLFNGYYEGLPGLVIDRYANTIVISNHTRQPENLEEIINQIAQFCLNELPWVESVLLKTRHSSDPEERKGRLLSGQLLPKAITENGIRYAVDLRLNQDDSFYPDTRNLRSWLTQHSHGKSVLNCFAYTGSLGIAALAGGATELIQTDLNGEALALAERSFSLNGFKQGMTILKRDFFRTVNAIKTSDRLFDTVILDSPFFSSTRYGKVDLQQQHSNLINKVRPLVGHEGKLVMINNALYVPGTQIMDEINELSKSGYVSLDEIVQIPADITGYPGTISVVPPTDPAPFNHPTKICILTITRKDQRRAN
ncbi:MAG: SAM-dependent methyltransferase [Chloroflexi bacterium]|nr:SAM-dependent methyltransferase [Chloroflexota bacterium]